MDTMNTTIPPVLRALRLLGLTADTVCPIAGIDPIYAEDYADGTKHLSTRHALFLTLLGAQWLSLLEKSLRPLPNVIQQAERHLVAARQLLMAQDRRNSSVAVKADYDAPMARWGHFQAQAPGIWDTICDLAVAAPELPGNLNILVGEHEYLH